MTIPAPVAGSAGERMADHLTVPFARGADRIDLRFGARATTTHGDLIDYDFAEHRARYGGEPEPRYVLHALRGVPAATTLTVHYAVPGPGGDPVERRVSVSIPAGTVPGASFAIPLGADTATAQLRAIDVTPAIPAGQGPVPDHWRVSALLGDLASVLWALGAERDTLTAHLTRVRGQRSLARATGRSLDLIGSDMAVRRFPPLPYTFEDGTVALYHLDEPAGRTQVDDATELYRPGGGHPGTVHGLRLGGTGRFGPGVQLDQPGEIRIADHRDFAVSTTDSLTIECFVKPDPGGEQGTVVSKHAGSVGLQTPGWALSVGSFGRGLARNVRLLLFDGQRSIALFTDVSLDIGRFQHLRGVLDRASGHALLYLDGVLRASQSLNGLGALTNSEPVRIGRIDVVRGEAFRGVVDEVRISRVARHGFHPVLGESDDSYRRRLEIFRRWTLPTPANLQAALNQAAGEVAGTPEPFVVDDTNAAFVAGARTLTIRPTHLGPDESMDALGRREVAESEGSGTAADDDLFDAALLADGSDDRVVFTLPSGSSPGADPRRMRISTRRTLRRLLDLLGDLGPPASERQLVVLAGFDPGATDLRAVGRALIVRHETLPSGELAALAHRAGFSWVRHRAATGDVYASMASTDTVELVAVPGDPDPAGLGFDALIGQNLMLRISPAPPPGTQYRWSIVHHEHGRAQLVSRATDAECILTPTATGRLSVKVEVRRAGRTVTASRTLRVGLVALPPNTGIAGDGRLGVDESVAGEPADAPFAPSYLYSLHSFPFLENRLPTVGDANRMLPTLIERLRRFLDLLGANNLAGTVRLISAWQPNSNLLDGVGRALTLQRAAPGLPVDRIAALAHAAGFDFVRADTGSGTIRLAHRSGDPVRFVGPFSTEDGLPRENNEIAEGDQADFLVLPAPFPAAMVMAARVLCVANSLTATVSFLDTTTGTVLRSAATGVSPVGIAARPDGALVYTANSTSRSVSVINVATGVVVRTIPLPAPPLAIAHHPSRPSIIVLAERELLVLDENTGQLAGSIPLEANAIAFALDAGEGRDRAWIGSTDGLLRAIDLAGGIPSAQFAVSGPVWDVAVSGNRVYVTVRSAGRFHVVDAVAETVTTFADAGTAPTILTVDEAGGGVYVADSATSRISTRHLDGTATQPGTSAPVAGRITDMIAVPDRLFVTTIAVPPLGGADAVGVFDISPPPRPLPPPARPRSPLFWWLGASDGELLQWSAQGGADAKVRLSSRTPHIVRLFAERAGPVLLIARYTDPGNPPYTVQIRLHPQLEALERAGAPVVIRKDQYDLVMNVLSELHPLGVEIDTRVIREHVLELRAGLLEAFPAYTYPTYRGRRPALFSRENR